MCHILSGMSLLWSTILEKNINDHPINFFIHDSSILLILNQILYNVTSTVAQLNLADNTLGVNPTCNFPKYFYRILSLYSSTHFEINLYLISLRLLCTHLVLPKETIGRIELCHTDCFKSTRQNLGPANTGVL